MSIQITITGADTVISTLQRGTQRAGEAQRTEVRRVGGAYLTALRTLTPVGKGERPGRLRKAYQTQAQATSTSASFRITNTTPYIRFVTEGRGPVEAKPGKMLRFVINGRVFFRKRVGPAKANPFDEKAAQQMESDLNGLAESVARRIAGALEGGR